MIWHWEIIKKELSFDKLSGIYFYTLALLPGAHNVPLPYHICKYSDADFKIKDVIAWEITPTQITLEHLVKSI